MFRFADMGRAWVPVELPTNGNGGGDDGDAGTARVMLLMDLYTDAELDTRDRDVMLRSAAGLMEQAKTASDVGELAGVLDQMQQVKDTDRAELAARTHDWRGVEDANGDPVPFTAEAFAALLGMAYLFRPVRRALFDASREGVLKN